MSCASSCGSFFTRSGQVEQVARADEVAHPLGIEDVAVERVRPGRRVEQRLVVDRLEADRDDVDVPAGQLLPVRRAPLERLRDLRAVERQQVDADALELRRRATRPRRRGADAAGRRFGGAPDAAGVDGAAADGDGLADELQAVRTRIGTIAAAIDRNRDTTLVLLLTHGAVVQHTEHTAVGWTVDRPADRESRCSNAASRLAGDDGERPRGRASARRAQRWRPHRRER